MKRYGAVRYCDMGCWSFSPDDVKECDDGELIKYDDHVKAYLALRKRLDAALDDIEWMERNMTINDFPEPR